jgi:hypothetical protein
VRHERRSGVFKGAGNERTPAQGRGSGKSTRLACQIIRMPRFGNWSYRNRQLSSSSGSLGVPLPSRRARLVPLPHATRPRSPGF